MYKILPILLFAYGLALTTEDIYDNSYALIIGIGKYENVQNLDYAVKDAVSIQHILVNSFDFPAENTILLTDEEATKTSILQEFSNLTKKAGENDRVLIFFAGHGMTGDLPSGGELGYLIPVDGNIHNLYISSIGMNEFHNISLMTNAKHMLYLVDACYGGIASFSTRGFELNSTAGYIRKIAQDKSRQLITAGGRGEQVIEKAEWGHSAFSLNLLRGLGGGRADLDEDGAITASELGIYLKEKVTIDSENIQTPQIMRLTSNVGEFIFIKSEEDFIKSEAEIYIQTLEQVMNQEKQKSYDFLIDNLDSVMQSSNYESMLSELSKEQLITLFSLSNKQKDILSVNSKEKELFSEKGSFYDNSFAVIIGINEYTKSQPLQYAVNDAIAIKELLIEKFGFKDENVRLLIDAEATYSSIRNELYSVAKLAKTNDRILIYFLGMVKQYQQLNLECK